MNFTSRFYILLLLFITLWSCNRPADTGEIVLPYSVEDFEKEIDGKQTRMYILKNENDMLLTLSNYGARIVSLYAPDRDGALEDVVLGSPSLEEYIHGNPGVGATIGPVANRISDAQFVIDGVTYHLPSNKGTVCHHSGPNSFYRQVWEGTEIMTDSGPAVEMALFSDDGQWGFPGNKEVTVRYTLTDDNALYIDYTAVTDKSCYMNLTNHAYFNLGGPDTENIEGHFIKIDADSITPFGDERLVPSGEIMAIKGTDLDFTGLTRIGDRINSPFPQMQMVHGYDHNYVLNKSGKSEIPTFCAKVVEPISGRVMECYTTEPAVQFYTANFLDGTMKGNGRDFLTKRSGFCLETQHFPDSPHHVHFPNTLISPEDTLRSRTIYKLLIQDENNDKLL